MRGCRAGDQSDVVLHQTMLGRCVSGRKKNSIVWLIKRRRGCTYNKGVVGELVSVEEMLEEVGALVAGVSPRHSCTHRTHLQVQAAQSQATAATPPHSVMPRYIKQQTACTVFILQNNLSSSWCGVLKFGDPSTDLTSFTPIHPRKP